MKVDCPYTDKCTNAQKKCNSCTNNKRRSYYEPIMDYSPWYPYVGPYPWCYWDNDPYIIACDNTTTTLDTTSYYESAS